MVLPQGWFNAEDVAEYRSLVASLPDGARMVEVGVWLGRSLCSVADLIVKKGIQVTAVDLGVKKSALRRPPPPHGQKETFLRNVRKRGIEPTCLWMSTFDAAEILAPVDFVFLDDDHEYAHVVKEIEAWLPKAKLLIGGHDYHAYKAEKVGVKQAVDERFPHAKIGGRVWSVRLDGA